MSKSAIYARCSTIEQFPENQLISLRELAQRNGNHVVFEFVDSGQSGVKREREQLNAMLEAARKGRFQTLYVAGIDRLSRSVKDLIEVVELLNGFGIQIVFQREGTPLEKNGWTGVVVEPQPDCCDALRRSRKSPIFQCACVSPQQIEEGISSIRLFLAGPQSSTDLDFISPRDRTENFVDVPAKTLNQVAEEAGLLKIDLLSLDTEGTEIDVMKGLDWEKYKPKLVILEDHARNFSKHNFMTSLGYVLFRRTGFNSWYSLEKDALPVSLFGYVQLFRKYVLGMPGRNLRRWRHKTFG